MNSTSLHPQPLAKPVREILHGVEVEDRFRWLENRDSSETRAFIHSEQKAYREYLREHSELRKSIEPRVKELLTVESIDLPVSDRHGGLIYLKRKAEEEQKAIYHRNASGEETLLLSVESLGRDTYTSLSLIQVSPDGHYFAFALRRGGEDVQEISIYDLQFRRLLADRLPSGFYRGLVFDSDGTGFFYVHEETEGRFQTRRSVRRHVFGDDQHIDDEMFCASEDESVRLIVQGADDNSALGYTILFLESEPRILFFIHRFPLIQPPELVLNMTGASFGARFNSQGMTALTTFAAPLGRIVSISPQGLASEDWEDIIPQTTETLYGFDLLNEAIVANYLIGTSKITRVFSKAGKLLREVFYPSDATVTVGQVDAAQNRLFYALSDIKTPLAIYEVDLTTGKTASWWQELASGWTIEPEAERHIYLSRDGIAVPLTLIRSGKAHGPCPVLLSVYGGGGVSNTPKFSALLTILLEFGFSCAIAHVRGGGEGGHEWHAAAQKQLKQVSVDDLLAAAEWLLENGITITDHLGVAGQSNGALLALCSITQRPELFRAALALGPIADLTRFHLFGVGRGFVDELGSPENPEEFAALYKLSPYHGIQPDARYPAVLIVSGDRDKRCDSLHARKMTARLREANRSDHSTLLDYTEERGHKPVLPLAERIRSLSDRLTFLIAELSKITPPELPS